VTSPLLAGLARLCSRRHIPLCIDPKSREIRYRGATLLKPNVRELEELSGVRVNNAASLDAAAARLLRQQTCDYLLVTRGAHGMVLYERNGGRTEICTGAQQVADVTGAGDTAAAALTVAMACGAEPRDAAILANLAAGVVVSKPGTEIVKPQEILAAVGVTSAALRSNIAE
jgi:D-beta-D-heptose 7-phosphate kinase/D-beta-D-heptose 1-phosphate adenosyltransferase